MRSKSIFAVKLKRIWHRALDVINTKIYVDSNFLIAIAYQRENSILKEYFIQEKTCLKAADSHTSLLILFDNS